MNGGAGLPGPVLAEAGLMAAATVAGAWLARRRRGHREIWFAAAAGALLIIAGLHLLPMRRARRPRRADLAGLVPGGCGGRVHRREPGRPPGCACQEHEQRQAGWARHRR